MVSEILLHHVLDEEVDANPPPAPEDAILPRVLSLLSSFKQYLDIVVQCTRKTEVRVVADALCVLALLHRSYLRRACRGVA